MRNVVLAVLVFLASSQLYAAILTTGDLVYDDETNYITGGGNIYVSWNAVSAWDYATTLENLTAAGLYEGFRIASQTEAFEFFNLAHDGADVIDNPGMTAASASGVDNGQARFGNNYNSSWSYAKFLSDESMQVGYLESHNSYLRIYDDWSSIASSDAHSRSNPHTRSMAWLLVSDTQTLVDVPEPPSFLLVGLGLAVLVFMRRRVQS